MEIKLADIIYMRPTKWFGVGLQISAICLLLLIQVAFAYFGWPKGNHFVELFRLNPWAVLAPIYEEIIFRGLIFSGLTRYYSVVKSAVIVCILFGIWHIKNIMYPNLAPYDVLNQVAYAGLIIGPILMYLTIRTRSIWFGVMVHYLNNILAPMAVIGELWIIHHILR